MFATVDGVLAAVWKLVLAVAALTIAAALYRLVRARGFQRFRVAAGRLGSIELDAVDLKRKLDTVDEVAATLVQVAADTAAINRAVNHQPDDAPTLVLRVVRVEDTQTWLVQALQAVAHHVGCSLPDPPDTATTKEPTT